MTVESSTPETAAAVLVSALRRYSYGIVDEGHAADVLLAALSAAGFTVVSGGEGLQHGADMIVANIHTLSGHLDSCLDELGRTDVSSLDWLREFQRFAAVASGAAPGTTAEPRPLGAGDEANIAVLRKGDAGPFIQRWAAEMIEYHAAAGATAPETTGPPLSGVCAQYGIHAWRWGSTMCDRCGAAAGSTAPERTPAAACEACGGWGGELHRSRLNPAFTPCLSCGGSGVKETTP